ncbi:MAG TPA: HAMP domain-containing sensor histidine kinase [Candidatus Egerieousia sp.]|nr:HAMP domain-containing sensor histidine kinase [Candidatus Egerieousia sp.]
MKSGRINRKSYKRVTWWVISCLILLAMLQTWSLLSIYRERVAEFDKAIISAMNRAAYEEVTTSAAAIQKPFFTAEKKTIIESSEIPRSLTPNAIQSMTIKKSNINDSIGLTNIYINTKKDTVVFHSPKKTYKTTFVSYGGNQLVYNLHRYDSLLQINLFSNNICLPYKVDIVKKDIEFQNLKLYKKRNNSNVYRNDSGDLFEVKASNSNDSNVKTKKIGQSAMSHLSIRVKSAAKEKRNYEFNFVRDSVILGAVQEISDGKDSVVISNKSDNTAILHNPRTYSISVYNGKGLFFRVRIDNPNKLLIRELKWIIITTCLILLLVAFIFIYLLRTIFRQKTLEKMRIDFTHNITHELKTPISVAYAANDAMENFGAADDEKKRAKYLEIIREQLKELSGMVERILSASRDEMGGLRLNKERIELYDFLQDIVEPYRRDNVQLDVSVEPGNLLVVGDRFHLEHMFNNLIDNSIKYSGENVAVTFAGDVALNADTGENAAADCQIAKTIKIEINAYRDEKIVIKFSDNGIGIPAVALPHIFEKYYRVTKGNLYTVKGFGLGLYYVKMVIEAHGGTISVASKEGEGSTFTIVLPS